MMELVTTVTLIATAFLFAYITFKLPKQNQPLKLLFIVMSLLMVYLTIGALYSSSLAPERRLNYTTEHSITYNCGDLTNQQNCTNTTTMYIYGNYTRVWTYEPTQAALSLIQYLLVFIMFYYFILFFVGLIHFLFDSIKKVE